MKSETDLATIQPANNSAGFLQIIDRVVGTGEMTPEKVSVLERLLAMQQTAMAERHSQPRWQTCRPNAHRLKRTASF